MTDGVAQAQQRVRGDAQEEQTDNALAAWDARIEADPDDAEAHHQRGLRLHGLGQVAEAIESVTRAFAINPADVVIANNLAVMLSDAGRREEALRQFRRARALQPDNLHIIHQIRRLCAELVPFWHIPMLNDRRRNIAFESAIMIAIAQRGRDALVLDIGAGSGLLSLMAARAGAQQVVACEVVPVIAEVAKEIVSASPHAGQIAIVNKMSTALEVGTDLPRRADILVSEILSSDLLAEQVLNSFEDAHRRLLAEDAIIIPRRATAIGCLIASRTLSDYSFVDTVEGFDLSPFNELGPLKSPIHGTLTQWSRLSDDAELVSLDLTAREQPADLQHLPLKVTASGRAIGIVQWMKVDLIEGVTFDNHPDDYTDGGWLQVLHRFPAPIDVQAGQTLHLAVGHDRATLIIFPMDQLRERPL